MKLAFVESRGIGTVYFLESLLGCLSETRSGGKVKQNLDLESLSDLLNQLDLIHAIREMRDKTDVVAAIFMNGNFLIRKEKLESLIWELKEEEKEIKIINNTINGDGGHIGNGDHCIQKEK